MKNYVIVTLLFFNISSFYAQTMCLSCKGSGRSWQEGQDYKKQYLGTERKVVMGEVVYLEKYREAYSTDGRYVTCAVCSGKGVVKSSTKNTTPKAIKKPLTEKEKYQMTKQRAHKKFPKGLYSLGDNYFRGIKSDGTIRLLRINADKERLEIVKHIYHDYKKIMDLDNKSLVGYSFVRKGLNGKTIKTDLLDSKKYLFVESYGDLIPTIYRWVFWIYDKNGNPQLYDVTNKKNINTEKIKFPTKKFEDFDYYMFYNNLFPSKIKTKDFRGKDTYALGVYNRKGKLIVPAKNEKILDFDDRTMSLAVVNNYGLVDVYNAKNGFLKFPRGVVVKTCKNGATILKDKKFSYDARDVNGRTRQVEAYTYIEKNGFRIPYVLKSCECRDVNNNLKIELYRHGKYIVNSKNEFIPLKK